MGHGFHQDVHRTTGGHGRCDAYDFLILLGQFKQRFAKHILKSGRFVVFVLHDTFTAFLVELARSVPNGGFFLCRFEPLAFHRVDVQQFGTSHVFYFTQGAYQGFHIVSVHWSEVSDVHSFEDVLLVREE